MKKTIQNIVAINVVQWYLEDETQERLSTLPLKIQWILRKNVKELESINNTFNDFRNNLIQQRNDKWFNEENGKCEKTIDENGKSILKIKEEFLKDFYEFDNELNKQIKDIVNEEIEIEFKEIDIEDLIEDDDLKLTIVDLEMINVFSLEK